MVDLALAPAPGFKADVGTFAAAAMRLHVVPWRDFYAQAQVQSLPPAYLYALSVVGWLLSVFGAAGGPTVALIVKAPAILAHAAFAALATRHYQRWRSSGPRAGTAGLWSAAAVWALNPALLYNAAVFGQVDAIGVLLGAGTVAAAIAGQARRAAFLGAVAVGFGSPGLMSVAAATVIAGAAWKSWRLGPACYCVMIFVCTLAALAVPFGVPFWALPPLNPLGDQASFAAINAFNLPAALGWNWGALSERTVFGCSRLMFQVGCTVGMLGWLGHCARSALRRWSASSKETMHQGLLLLAAAAGCALYLFAPNMHERSFFMVFPMLPFLFGRRRLLSAVCIGASTVLAIDQMAVVDATYDTGRTLLGVSPLLIASALVKLAGLGALILELLPPRQTATRPMLAVAPPASAARLRVADAAVLFVIALVSAAQGLYRLGADSIPQSGIDHSFALRLELPPGSEAVALDLFFHHGSGNFALSCAATGEALRTSALGSYRQWRRLDLAHPCAGPLYLTADLGAASAVGAAAVVGPDGATLHVERICDTEGSPCVTAANHPLFKGAWAAEGHDSFRGQAIFDEIYFVRAANELLAGQSLSEFTHPPFGKVLIALSIRAFGDHPAAWRLPAAVAGSGLPLLTFLVAWTLFRRRSIAYLAAVLSLFDLLRIAMEGIGTVDAVLAFLILAAFGLFRRALGTTRRPGVWFGASGLLWGLAIATKWIGLFCLPPYILMIWLAQKRERRFSLPMLVTALAVVPVLAYAATYIPLVAAGSMPGSLTSIVEAQKAMYVFHSTLRTWHPYSSRFFEWLVIQRPLLLFQDQYPPAGQRSLLVALGNPMVIWAIPVAVGAALYRRRLGASTAGRDALLLMFFGLLLPWALISRTSFYYHYLTPSIFGSLLLAEGLSVLGTRRRLLVAAFLVAALLATVAFFPLATGATVPGGWIECLQWFRSWQF